MWHWHAAVTWVLDTASLAWFRRLVSIQARLLPVTQWLDLFWWPETCLANVCMVFAVSMRGLSHMQPFRFGIIPVGSLQMSSVKWPAIKLST